jgi:hypothetical protein
MLRESDLHLPTKGWGRIVLAASASRAGRSWTDHGTARQERGLKHCAAHETCTIPVPPRPRPAAPRPHQAVQHDPGRRVFQTAPGRDHPGLGLQRRVGRGPRPGAAPVAARSAPV